MNGFRKNLMYQLKLNKMKHLIKKEPTHRSWIKRPHSNQSMKGSKKMKRLANKSFRMFIKKLSNSPINYKRNIDYEY